MKMFHMIEEGMIRRALAKCDCHQFKDAHLIGISDREFHREPGKFANDEIQSKALFEPGSARKIISFISTKFPACT